jgi:hypothetical protein
MFPESKNTPVLLARLIDVPVSSDKDYIVLDLSEPRLIRAVLKPTLPVHY